MPGALYVVATPLGHLGDLTERAATTLRTAAIVAAEDTRRTRTLLAHLDARPRVISYHAHSQPAVTTRILRHLEQGDDVALVTDAGSPAISDPGSELVRRAAERGIPVVPIPGPSAVAAALSVSGFSADRFLFLGFLPRRGRTRRERLTEVARSPWTVVVFEAAPRLASLLSDLAGTGHPDRQAVVAREMTKAHEEFRRGTLAELAGYYGGQARAVRGEVTVVIEGGPGGGGPAVPDASAHDRARELLAQGMTRRDAARQLAREYQWNRNAAYRFVATV